MSSFKYSGKGEVAELPDQTTNISVAHLNGRVTGSLKVLLFVVVDS
jgi:hypothetical protein